MCLLTIKSLPKLFHADDQALQSLSPTVLKSTYAALVAFILESAKHNTDPIASTYVSEICAKRASVDFPLILSFYRYLPAYFQ